MDQYNTSSTQNTSSSANAVKCGLDILLQSDPSLQLCDIYCRLLGNDIYCNTVLKDCKIVSKMLHVIKICIMKLLYTFQNLLPNALYTYFCLSNTFSSLSTCNNLLPLLSIDKVNIHGKFCLIPHS